MSLEVRTRQGWKAITSLLTSLIGTTELTDDGVTNAKLADMVQATFKGRASGAGTGNPTDLTAAQARAIIVSLDPVVTTLESGSLGSGATATMVEDSAGLWATYRELILTITGESSDTASRIMLVRHSIDSGSNYIATNYQGAVVDSSGAGAAVSTALAQGTSNTAAQTCTLIARISGHQGANIITHFTALRSDAVSTIGVVAYNGGVSAMNAIQILLNGSGNFDAGTYTLVGIK